MSAPKRPVGRQPDLKIATNVISGVVAVLLGLFCTSVCRWMGMREFVLFWIQLISMGILFAMTRAAIYGIVDSFAPGKKDDSMLPEHSGPDGRQASLSTQAVLAGQSPDQAPDAATGTPLRPKDASPRQRSSTAAVPAEKTFQRMGRFIFFCVALTQPMIVLVSVVACKILFQDQYAGEYGETLGMTLTLLVWLPCWTYCAVLRFHDLDRSGWWVLTLLIPLVQCVPFIYLYCWPGTPGPNRFGIGEDESAAVERRTAAMAG